MVFQGQARLMKLGFLFDVYLGDLVPCEHEKKVEGADDMSEDFIKPLIEQYDVEIENYSEFTDKIKNLVIEILKENRCTFIQSLLDQKIVKVLLGKFLHQRSNTKD